jgi:hypothetical protein
MVLSLFTHVLIANLWDDPRLSYLVWGHIGHLCAVPICGLLVSQSLCPNTLFHWGQFLIVLIIWAFQLWISPIWLSKFRFGPLEWLWRSLTYFKFQPMLK